MKTTVLFLNIVICTGFLYLLQGCAAATDSEDEVVISGEVLNANTGNAISEAIVQITAPPSQRQQTVSDSVGGFTFTVQADSVIDITIEVSKTSYNGVTQPITVAPGVDQTDLEIELQSAGTPGGGGNEGENEVEGEAGGPASIVLNNISNQAINVAETGGTVNTTFTFAVEDSAGRAVGQGHEMQFEIIRGPGGGESITPAIGTTNPKGMVTSNLFSGDSSGTVRIEAKIERPDVGLTIRSTPVLVSIISGFPVLENFHVVPEVHNFEAFGFLNGQQTNTISASLGDLKNNPVIAGTAVYFWAEGGGNIGNSVVEVATDERGLASVEMRADGSTPTDHPDGIGFVDVFAQTVDVNNDYITRKTTLLFTTRQAIITSNPTSFAIGNGGGESFTYTVTDQNGYPMAAGTTITVEAGAGLTVSGDVNIEVPDSFTPGPGTTDFGFSITDADSDVSEPANDNITIAVITPSGYRSSLSISGSRAKTIGN